MILTDNEEAYNWFKRARHEGRDEIPYTEDNIKFLGWNMYMTPPDAADGLWLMSSMPKHNEDTIENYPDLTKNDLFKKNEQKVPKPNHLFTNVITNEN